MLRTQKAVAHAQRAPQLFEFWILFQRKALYFFIIDLEHFAQIY